MWSLVVVEVKVLMEPVMELLTGLVQVDVYVLILDRPPQALDKDIVETSSSPVHADSDVVLAKKLGKGFTGELRALVGIEYLRPFML